MMLYLVFKKSPDISFDVHCRAWFTHNTKSSHVCSYLQRTTDNGLVFNPPKKLVVDCYADEDFVVLWVQENSQDPIYARSRNVFLVTFSNCPLLWV